MCGDTEGSATNVVPASLEAVVVAAEDEGETVVSGEAVEGKGPMASARMSL